MKLRFGKIHAGEIGVIEIRVIQGVDAQLGTGNWEPGTGNLELESSTTEVTLLLEWLAVWVRTIIEIDPPLFRIVCQHAHSHEICFSTKGETEMCDAI